MTEVNVVKHERMCKLTMMASILQSREDTLQAPSRIEIGLRRNAHYRISTRCARLDQRMFDADFLDS